MNDKILITNLKDITLSTAFVQFNAPNGLVTFDIQKLARADAHSEDAYMNATELAKMFCDTRIQATQKVKDYLRNKKTKELIQVIEKHRINDVWELSHIKKPSSFKVKFARKGYKGKKTYLNGVWFHKDLALDYMRFLDAEFAYMCDKFLMQVIAMLDVVKVEREDCKVLYRPLTDVVKEIYMPAQESGNARKWAYNRIADLCNQWGMGMISSKFRELNSIEDKNKPIRECMSKETLERVKQAEKHVHSLIFYAGITDYDELKERLFKLK